MKNLKTKLLAALAAILASATLSHAIFTFTTDRMIAANTSIPAVSSCGTGTINANSSDLAGEFTATGATGCTLTFGTAFATAPSCVVTEETVNTAARTTTVTSTTLVVASGTSGSKYSYVCVAKSGG